MINCRRKIINLCFAMLILFSSFCIQSFAATAVPQFTDCKSYKTIVTNDGVFLLGINDKKIVINNFNKTYSFTLQHNYLSCAYSNGDFYIAGTKLVDQENGIIHTLIGKFNLKTNQLSSVEIKANILNSSLGFAVDEENYFYFVDKSNPKSVVKYNYKGEFISRINCNKSIKQIFFSKGTLYAFAENKLFYQDNNQFCACNYSFNLRTLLYSIGNEYYTDSRGLIFKCSTAPQKVFDTQNVCIPYCTVAITQKYAICLGNNKLLVYDIKSKIKINEVDLDCEALEITSLNNKVYVFGKSNSQAITDVLDENTLAPEQSNTNQGNSDNSNSNAANQNVSIPYSKLYKFDNKNYYITNIPFETTISVFKSNIAYNGFDFSMIYNGKIKSTGNVGTNMTARFSNETATYQYKTIISGDITGEGNINSRDKSRMFNVLLNKDSLENVFFIAGDLNNDNIIDVKDLLRLAKMM